MLCRPDAALSAASPRDEPVAVRARERAEPVWELEEPSRLGLLQGMRLPELPAFRRSEPPAELPGPLAQQPPEGRRELPRLPKPELAAPAEPAALRVLPRQAASLAEEPRPEASPPLRWKAAQL